MMKRNGILAAAAMMLIGAAGSMAALPANSMSRVATPHAVAVRREERRLSTAGSGWRGMASKRGPGWSNRHVKRMAAKKRNQARNRSAHRGQ
jgi:hypothetical protein